MYVCRVLTFNNSEKCNNYNNFIGDVNIIYVCS